MTKHTPGPWDYDGPPHNIIVWSSPENRICFMTSDGPTEANARLIAAAPDLLAALKAQEAADEANEARVGYSEWQELENIAKVLRVAAIAKAEGQQ